MKLSDYIVSYFENQGIRVIFGYIGGMITHLVDSIDKNKQVQFVQTYHEQTAAIAAEGYALESGKFGVAISTSGPGATNMVTGIADAYFGSIPVIYITGQVNSYEYKYNKPIRQQGFQETDVVSIVASITKYAKLVDCACDIRMELEKATHIATSGRKGPVLLDIPMDIQRTEIDPYLLQGYTPENTLAYTFDKKLITDLLATAKHPMLLLGAGCIGEKEQKEIAKFIRRTNIPVVTSLMGRGAIDESYSNYLGMIGAYGNRCANMSITDVDLLLVLGSRLDTRQTGAKIESFIEKGKIIHVDIDNDELIHHRLSNRLNVHCDVYAFLQYLNTLSFNSDYSKWNKQLQALKKTYSQAEEVFRFVENKTPYQYMELLNDYTKENDVITVDIGQNQMWSAQTLRLKKGQRFVTSGGLAPMGFSLPVAIGIAFANPQKTIYSINGDGGFHMALQSLLLISQYNLKIKVILLNNNSLGMITQFQHLYFHDRMVGTTAQGGYITPNIEGLAASYGLPYYKITKENLQNRDVLNKIFTLHNGVIECIIDGLTTVSPKVEFNRPIYQPSPQINKI